MPLPHFTLIFHHLFTTFCSGLCISLVSESAPMSNSTAGAQKGREEPCSKSLVLSEMQDPFELGATPLPCQPQDRGSSEECTVLGGANLPVPAVSCVPGRDLQPRGGCSTQDTAPGDAEVERGQKKGCAIKETHRPECKLLPPRGGSQRKSLLPCFHCGFIHNSATQALGCICSFPLCSQSAPAGPRGLRPPLLDGF